MFQTQWKCWLAGCLIVAGGGKAFAQRPSLELVEASPAGTTLRALTSAPGNLNLEGSFDLANWFYLESGFPEGGAVLFAHTNDWPANAIFYRVASEPAPLPVRVSAQLDTNHVAATLITPEEGGRMSLTLASGMRYEFEAGTNLVQEPVPVRMTLITNFTDFPSHDGHRAAVAFSPEGLTFKGEARLKIVFPASVPREDMLAYSFAEDGSGFHLIPSRPETNLVDLRISHFSGAGVASFRSSTPPNFNRAWTDARDAVHSAEDRASRRNHNIYRDEFFNRITDDESRRRERESRLRMMEEIYRDAVRPYEAIAAADCAIGSAVVFAELNRLAGLWQEETRGSSAENPYAQKLREIAPKVRCACAKALIERCENDPNASGSALLRSLDNLLWDSRLATGSTDAQGCELGSDDQIRARLLAGPCFDKWVGTVVLTTIKSRIGTGTLNNLTQTWDDETREIYFGRVTGIKSERSFTVGGKLNTAWTLNTSGRVYFGHRVNQVLVTDSPASDIVETARVTESTSDGSEAVGEISLTLTDGAFTRLGVGGGNSARGYQHLYTHNEERSYRCKVPFPPNNPCPSTTSFSTTRSISFFQGDSVDKGDLDASVTVTDRAVNVIKNVVVERPNDFGPPSRTEERVAINLVRVSKQ